MNEIPAGYVEIRPGEYEKPKRQKFGAQAPILGAKLRAETGESLAKSKGPEHIFTPLKTPPPKRMRQDSKPLLNGLEARFLARLSVLYPPGTRIMSQAMRVKISASSWYKCDFFLPGVMHAHEVKGPRVMKNQQSRQILALKVAAAQWPEITWFLNWHEDGQWWQQKVNSV